MEARFHRRVQTDLDAILDKYYEISPELGEIFRVDKKALRDKASYMLKVRSKLILSRALVLVMLLPTMACGESKSTDTSSAAFKTVAEKQAFLERYLKVRRTYEKVEFHIDYKDGGDGLLPSPTDWDIRIVATVPADEMDAWTAGLKPGKQPDAKWLAKVPNAPKELGSMEWFMDRTRLVGIDRKNRMIVYRNLSQ